MAVTSERQYNLFKSRRQRGVRAPPALEVKTHIALADTLDRWVKKDDWLWTHIPLGGKRTLATGSLLKRMGAKPGWPDFIFIAWTGHVYFLELKRVGNDLSEHQDAFFAACAARGIECRAATGYKEAVTILQKWGVLPNRLHVQ